MNNILSFMLIKSYLGAWYNYINWSRLPKLESLPKLGVNKLGINIFNLNLLGLGIGGID